MPGPLEGLKVVELAGLAPAPFGCMVLADLGASVVRVDRVGGAPAVPGDVLGRGRRSIGVDVRRPEGAELVLRLVAESDVLVEGFRPGVTERLGIGPAQCLARNPRLVYGRMTGWGQSGPLADRAGHDINYIAVAGALEPIGRPGQPPTVPLNLVGDFGGGGLLTPLPLVPDVVVRQGDWAFRLDHRDGVWTLHSSQGGGWTTLYDFTEDPRTPADYEVLNHYLATHPKSVFLGRLVVQRTDEHARHSITDRVLTEARPDGSVVKRELTADELTTTLREDFGLELPTARA
ncbi:CoA transferase [Saccharothrix sp. MB29]|nr:CoA transferase [Saccharothrix sp. MB29]